MISVQQKIAVLTDIGASSLVEQTINKLIAMQKRNASQPN